MERKYINIQIQRHDQGRQKEYWSVPENVADAVEILLDSIEELCYSTSDLDESEVE